MPISAVVGVLVSVFIPAVAQLIVQIALQSGFHELGNGVLEQILNVIHAATFASCSSSRIFSRRAFSPGVRFFLAILITSILVLLFYTMMEAYTKFGMALRDTIPMGDY